MNTSLKKLSILGSTGSIGVSTLEIVTDFPATFQVVALAGGNNIDLLAQQVLQFNPRVVAVASEEGADQLAVKVQGHSVEILCGIDGMISVATLAEADLVVAAIVGAAGLVPTMAAVKSGKDIALANKETLVSAGALVMGEVARQNVRLIPVDSEHSAIFQALAGQARETVQRLILTASGGPFREHSWQQLKAVTPEDALAHPNWEMGKKITIDSASMMNKGLEVIEAHWLFEMPAEQISVLIHPESIVHSLVEFHDGAQLAQLGIPDMKTPIAYALSWPDRLPLQQPTLDLCQVGKLNFAAPDISRFPCLQLAYEALSAGGSMPAVMNAANEIAVDAFLSHRISFLGIPRLIEKVMERHSCEQLSHIDKVLKADLWGRRVANELILGGLK